MYTAKVVSHASYDKPLGPTEWVTAGDIVQQLRSLPSDRNFNTSVIITFKTEHVQISEEPPGTERINYIIVRLTTKTTLTGNHTVRLTHKAKWTSWGGVPKVAAIFRDLLADKARELAQATS